MIVLDASIVVKVLTEERGSDVALDRISREPDRIAPDWISAEIANALSKKVRYTDLPIDLACRYIDAVPKVVTDFVASIGLLDKALDLSVVLQHALYDCLYLALAFQENATLITADRKFVDAVSRSGLDAPIELLA